MEGDRTRSKLFIFDTCAIRPDNIPPVAKGSRPGLTVPALASEGAREAYSARIAARFGTESYAIDSSDGTYLSWALLPLLRGAAGGLADDSWVVKYADIQAQLLPRMSSYKKAQVLAGQEPVPIGEYAPEGLNRPKPQPMFRITLRPSSSSAVQPVEVTLERDGVGGVLWRRTVSDAPKAKPSRRAAISWFSMPL